MHASPPNTKSDPTNMRETTCSDSSRISPLGLDSSLWKSTYLPYIGRYKARHVDQTRSSSNNKRTSTRINTNVASTSTCKGPKFAGVHEEGNVGRRHRNLPSAEESAGRKLQASSTLGGIFPHHLTSKMTWPDHSRQARRCMWVCIGLEGPLGP